MTSFRFDINYQIVVSLVTRMHVLPPPPRMVGAGRSLKASPRNVEIHVFLYEFGATKALLCLLTHAFFHTSLVLVEKNRLRRCQQSFWALSSSFFFFFDQAFSSSMWVYLVAKFASRNGEGLNNPHLPSQKEVIQNTSYNYGFMLPCLCKSIVVMLE